MYRAGRTLLGGDARSGANECDWRPQRVMQEQHDAMQAACLQLQCQLTRVQTTLESHARKAETRLAQLEEKQGGASGGWPSSMVDATRTVWLAMVRWCALAAKMKRKAPNTVAGGAALALVVAALLLLRRRSRLAQAVLRSGGQ